MDDEFKWLMWFFMVTAVAGIIGVGFDQYHKSQVAIEAVKAGLVQDMHGNWVKPKTEE